MLRILPRVLASLVLAATLSIAPAAAQQSQPSLTGEEGVSRENPPDWPGGLEDWDSSEREPQNVNPDEAEQRGLTSPDVQRSQMPEPTAQGTRPPGLEEDETDETDAASDMTVSQLLREFRRAPPGLDGQRIARPNPLGSGPGTEMDPHPEGDIEVLFPDDYIE